VTDTLFKIRRESDGLFSTGGDSPNFTKRGKEWKQRGHVTSHLNQVRRPSVYEGCVIIECEIVVKEVDSIPVSRYLEAIRQRKADEAQRICDARKAAELKRQYDTYQQLKNKFEPK
jgi:hypothetical protein